MSTDKKLEIIQSAVAENVRQLAGKPMMAAPATPQLIRLHLNESPYPLPLPVYEAMHQALTETRYYPDVGYVALRETAGRVFGFSPEEVIAGNGSSEILSLLYKAFASEGQHVAMVSPGFTLNRKFAHMQNAVLDEVDFEPSYILPLEQLIECDRRGASFIVIANPNNPTGTLIPRADIEKLLQSVNCLVVLDEAYADFAPENSLKLVQHYPNLIVLRSLSKGCAVPGLRMGFGFAHADIIKLLRCIQNEFSLGSITQAVGKIILEQREHFIPHHKEIISERDKTAKVLSHCGFQPVPSHTNFIFAKTPDGKGGLFYKDSLERKGILITAFSERGLKQYVRISIGLPDQMIVFAQAIQSICAK